MLNVKMLAFVRGILTRADKLYKRIRMRVDNSVDLRNAR